MNSLEQGCHRISRNYSKPTVLISLVLNYIQVRCGFLKFDDIFISNTFSRALEFESEAYTCVQINIQTNCEWCH